MSVPAVSSAARTGRSVSTRFSWTAMASAFVVALIAAGLAVSVVVVIARALGVPPLPMFGPGVYLPFVAVGVLLGMFGWQVVRRVAGNPRRVLTFLVPLVLLVSVVPDVLTGVAGVPLSGVLTLVVMHLAVGAAAVPLDARLLPLPTHRSAAAAR